MCNREKMKSTFYVRMAVTLQWHMQMQYMKRMHRMNGLKLTIHWYRKIIGLKTIAKAFTHLFQKRLIRWQFYLQMLENY